jgi:hypothetical protein
MGVWLDYTLRSGAFARRTFRTADECRAFMSKLRRPATLHADGYDEPVGGILWDNLIADDKRVRWLWWFDPTVFTREEGKVGT